MRLCRLLVVSSIVLALGACARPVPRYAQAQYQPQYPSQSQPDQSQYQPQYQPQPRPQYQPQYQSQYRPQPYPSQPPPAVRSDLDAMMYGPPPGSSYVVRRAAKAVSVQDYDDDRGPYTLDSGDKL